MGFVLFFFIWMERKRRVGEKLVAVVVFLTCSNIRYCKIYTISGFTTSRCFTTWNSHICLYLSSIVPISRETIPTIAARQSFLWRLIDIRYTWNLWIKIRYKVSYYIWRDLNIHTYIQVCMYIYDWFSIYKWKFSRQERKCLVVILS